MNNEQQARIHFIGIKGIGISCLAQYFLFKGAKITGSDIKDEFQTDEILKKLGIKVKPFSSQNINKNIDLVIYSTAYNASNIEIKRAKKLKIPLRNYGWALAEIFNQGKTKILITGTHGKTTTTALLGCLLKEASLEPIVFVGGIVNNWQSNFLAGKNDFIVAEGDEYQEKFLSLKPDYLLITNITYDHPDYFKNKKDYKNCFEKLTKQTQKKVFIGKKIPKSFRNFLEKINFPLLGERNKENAYLVYRLAKKLKIPVQKIKQAFENFKGIKRRMEILNSQQPTANSQHLFVDDYAHHPEEIKATLSSLKEKYPDYKILAIFQPHTFSRTKALLSDFGKCFQKADFVYLLPTFSSARETKPKQDIDALLLKEIKKHHSKVKFFPNKYSNILKNIGMFLNPKGTLCNKTILLTLGAGDVYKVLTPHLLRTSFLFYAQSASPQKVRG